MGKPALGKRSTSNKHVTSMSCKLEPTMWPRDTGQRIPCNDRCQLVVAWLSNIKEVHSKLRLYVSVNLFFGVWPPCCATPSLSSCARAIPLAMITMRKSTHGFPFLSHDEYEAPLGGPLGRWSSANNLLTGRRVHNCGMGIDGPITRRVGF